MLDLNDTFVREIPLTSSGVTLKVHQCSEGDVGCVAWDAGLVLAYYLDIKNVKCGGSLMSGKKVVELGSGTGIVGLTAACLGGDVILTDLPEFLPLVELNIGTNKSILKGSACAKVLKWGESLEHFYPPDIILVGDCIYYTESLGPLFETLCNLCGTHTDILLSYEERDVGDKAHYINSFVQMAKEKFDLKYIPRCEHHSDFQSPDIHILQLRLR